MSFEGWIFFGVTYGREAKGPQEDKVKLLRLSQRAIGMLAAVFDREVASFLDRESKLYVENPMYGCDLSTEVFKIENFQLPKTFIGAIGQWQGNKSLGPEEMTPDRVKVIMGAKWTEDGILAAFKSFRQ